MEARLSGCVAVVMMIFFSCSRLEKGLGLYTCAAYHVDTETSFSVSQVPRSSSWGHGHSPPTWANELALDLE